MMNLLIKAILVLTFVALGTCMKREEVEEMGRKIVSECRIQEGGTEDDYNKWMTPAQPTTRAGHCMLACIHEKLGIVRENVFKNIQS